MIQTKTGQNSPARIAGRRAGAIVRISFQVAVIVMVWGDLPERFADAILTMVWVYVPTSLAVRLYFLCKNLEGSKINDCPAPQVVAYLFYFVKRFIDQHVLFAAFTLSIYAYGETMLAILCVVSVLISFVSHLAYATKIQEKQKADQEEKTGKGDILPYG